jgi:putative transposase
VTVSEDQQLGHPLGVPARPAAPESAREAINEMLEAGLLDEVMDRVDRDGLALTGTGGFLPELVKAVLERGLAAELTGHLGYEKGDPAGRGSPNSRNGSTPKTLATEVGDIPLAVPRDRAGTFEPRLVAKGTRRAGGLDDMIVSLYAGGMTVRDISHHLARTLGTKLSHDTISTITDSVVEEVQGLAVPAAGGDLPDPLPGRAGGEGARRPPGAQQGRAPGRRGRPGRVCGTCSASGCRPPRGRSSGPGCAPSCATAGCATC